MNKEQFYNIISDSSLLTNVDENSFDEIIKEFPYFQTAYILKTKILSDKGSFKYDNFIKLASLYSVDRSKLYNYIHTSTELKSEDNLTHQQNEEITKVEEVVNEETLNTETTDKAELVQVADIEENELITVGLESEKTETETTPEFIEEKAEVESVKESIDEIIKEGHINDEPPIIEPVKETDIVTEKQSFKEQETESVIEKTIETENDEIDDTKETELVENKLETIEKPKIKDEPKIVAEKIDKKPAEKEIPISANASLAEKIIHKYKDRQKEDKKESIADIILRKAAEAKKQKAKQTVSSTTDSKLTEKPKEIKVEKKTFEPVKLETKPELKEPENKNKSEKIVKETKPIAKVEKSEHKTEKEETTKLETVNKIDVPKETGPKTDILDEITKISEKEIISDYFEAEEVVETKPAKEEMSFEDWLNFVETPIKSSSEKNKEQISLIDKFITAEAEPKIKPKVDTAPETEQLVKSGEVERDDFITETLANIYIKQRLYEKAISAFTKLSLKYPEKNSYFANQIKKIEKLIKK